jgi:uncharacterized membrane protein
MKTQISIEGLYKRVNFVTARNNQATSCKPWKSLAAVTFGMLLSVPGLTQAQYQFSTIDVPGATATAANSNSTHEIAGDFFDAHGKDHGFVLNNGVFTMIDVPGAVNTIIDGINALGQLGGTYQDSNGTFHAFFGNKVGFTTLDPPNAIRSLGDGINAQGQLVGTYRTLETLPDGSKVQKRHGFIWRNGTFTTFNVPGDHPVFGTVAFGINDIGEVVGDYVDASRGIRHGFLRSSDGLNYTTLDVPGAVLTVGEEINNAGTIVGAYQLADSTIHGFVRNNGVFTTVDVTFPGGTAQQTEIFSINANGEIVGLYFDSNGGQHGFRGVPAQ